MNYSEPLENHFKSLEITKNHLNYFKDSIFNIYFGYYSNCYFLKTKFENFFSQYIRMNHSRHQNYKDEHTEMKYLNKTQKPEFCR